MNKECLFACGMYNKSNGGGMINGQHGYTLNLNPHINFNPSLPNPNPYLLYIIKHVN